MQYDPEYVARFYGAYDLAEGDRLEVPAYGRLQAVIHADFIKQHVRRGERVADIGSGPGRFSVEAAMLGAAPTLVDLSPQQLARAGERLSEAGVDAPLITGDVTDLSALDADSFDATLCFGGALSYVCDAAPRAVEELVRITKPGGVILASVMSRWGVHCNLVRRSTPNDLEILRRPDGANRNQAVLWEIFETGDLAGFISRLSIPHPAMHLYTEGELRRLFSECDVLETAGSNVTTYEGSLTLAYAAADPASWSTVVELERRLCRQPGLVDTGSHIIIAARKRSGR